MNAWMLMMTTVLSSKKTSINEDRHEMESFHTNTYSNIVYDDIPVDSTTHGKNFLLCIKNMNIMKMILTDNGWINPKTFLLSSVYNVFKPDRILSSHEWEADVKKLRQKCIDK